MKEHSEQFEDLFQDFFKEQLDASTKANKHEESVPQKKDRDTNDSFNNLIENLVDNSNKTDSITQNQPQFEQSKDTPPSLAQENLDSNFNIESGIQLNEVESNNIEGGSSAFVTNPEIVIPRSYEVDEILSYVPNWMIRWGITLFFFIMIGIVAMSYFIKYPDIVEGQIKITSEIAPATIVSKATGPLLLFKKDKDKIEEGAVIALIKNDAKYDDIQKLKKSLNKLKSNLDRGVYMGDFRFPRNMDLGSLQGTFSELAFSLKEQNVKQQSKGDNRFRKENINQQIQHILKMEREQNQQIASLEADYIRTKDIFEKRYRPLFKSGSISADQLDAKQNEVSQKYNAYQSAKAGFNEYRKRILDLESQKRELDFSVNQNTSSGLNSISIAYSKLINAINSWENDFLLTAPIAGRLNYLQFVKDNINISSAQEIASIVPLDSEDPEKDNLLKGELYISSAGIGKVKNGQVVNIELDAYLKKEFGIILGEVAEISDVGTTLQAEGGAQTVYKIMVNFQNGLNTTTGKPIQFKHNMQGEAEIITEDVRLIERIFNDLRELFDME